MPYRRRGKRILKKEDGKWVHVKTHPTVEKAKKHLAALRINVSQEEDDER